MSKLTFDDVLITPQFSEINSRKAVDLYSRIGCIEAELPIISANMDTITNWKTSLAMHNNGALACLHRFHNHDTNMTEYENGAPQSIVSFGLGEQEKQRCKLLHAMGARSFCLDVAHGAQQSVMLQTKWFKKQYPECTLIVGNFASVESVKEFMIRLGDYKLRPDAIKIGVGPGSACTTRLKTGCGYPQFSAIKEISQYCRKGHIKTIADGGMKTPGDIAKALGAGASMVMLGGMLSGTDETPGEIIYREHHIPGYVGGGTYIEPDILKIPIGKQYRGSASKESYKDQGKEWSTAEGESFMVDCKGPIKNVLNEIKGGLQSAFSYVGAENLEQFHKKVSFVQISNSTVSENGAHGKNN